jgi:hypothetical protein
LYTGPEISRFDSTAPLDALTTPSPPIVVHFQPGPDVTSCGTRANTAPAGTPVFNAPGQPPETDALDDGALLDDAAELDGATDDDAAEDAALDDGFGDDADVDGALLDDGALLAGAGAELDGAALVVGTVTAPPVLGRISTAAMFH